MCIDFVIVWWTVDNRFQLNIGKCKEIGISFSKNNADLPPLFINGQEFEEVQNARLRGATITNNRSWNLHINETIKKEVHFKKEVHLKNS